MREEYADRGPDAIVSRALADALSARVDRKEQALVLLNRRGFATTVFCRQCAGTLECPNCSVSLVVHGDGRSRRARCHYCNYSARVPAACPLCAGPYLEQSGFGTERVEAEVKRAFPAARVARLDRDSIRRKGALTALLGLFERGEIDVLVGTQMIAKGHDFPRVTLVGVVSADVGLGLADFRARGVPLGLVTNGDASQQRDKIERFELASFFEVIVIEGEFGAGKPDESVYRHALRHLGVEPGDASMVGDHLEFDVAGPQRLGVRGIWLDRPGAGLADSPVRPHRIIRSLRELTSQVNSCGVTARRLWGATPTVPPDKALTAFRLPSMIAWNCSWVLMKRR